jgi:phosphatidate cytidylyltransferase
MSSDNALQLKPHSDLGIRTVSGIAMMAVAIAAIWYGGFAFIALITFVGICVMWEFSKLVFGFVTGTAMRTLWLVSGLFYVGIACCVLIAFSSPFFGMVPAVMIIVGVIGTDIGAYFAGRTFGGPKIAPAISPSKTWSGLIGGMIGAGILLNMANHMTFFWKHVSHMNNTYEGVAYAQHWAVIAGVGAALAVVAQSGDFFDRWMKRKAGVKDSGRLIPGHGGLFDRTDGLIAVAFVAGIFSLVQTLTAV